MDIPHKLVVAFTGASGTGKTTLVYRLATLLRSKGYEVDTVTNIARQVLDRYGCGLDTIRSNPKLFEQFQTDVIYYRLVAEDQCSAPIVLCDRTYYDSLIYTLVYGGVDALIRVLRNVDARYSLDDLDDRYTVVFLCLPPEVSEHELDDGVRTMDDIKLIDSFTALFTEFGLYTHVLPPMDVDDRVSVVYEVIRQWIEYL